MERENTSSMLDTQLEALADARRRNILIALLDSESRTARLRPLTDGGAVGDGQRSEVKMRHVHLPKLSDCGFVDWDRATDSVSRGPAFDEIRPLLEHLYAFEGTPSVANP